MRERDGPYLCFDKSGRKAWLDAEHSSFRLPRRAPQQCLEPGCYANTPLVYCQRHYPRFRAYDCDITSTPLERLCLVDDLRRLISIATALPQPSLEHYKAVILLLDLFTLNWNYFKSNPAGRRAYRLLTNDVFTHGITSIKGHEVATEELRMRYAYLLCDEEFPPTVHPLNLEFTRPLAVPQSRTVAPTRARVTEARVWLASTGVVRGIQETKTEKKN